VLVACVCNLFFVACFVCVAFCCSYFLFLTCFLCVACLVFCFLCLYLFYFYRLFCVLDCFSVTYNEV
jgi:hypothetical protein